jgi:hypothetical protein
VGASLLAKAPDQSIQPDQENSMPAPVQALLLERNDWVPNNPRLPVLIYPQAIELKGSDDPAALFEQTFRANGWPPQWRYGVYDFHHYHTEGHEVLGVASWPCATDAGRARRTCCAGQRRRRVAAARRHRPLQPELQ